MSKLSPKQEFIPIATEQGGLGTLIIGEDGVVLYRAINVYTGESVTVCLYADITKQLSFMNAIGELQVKYNELLKSKLIKPKQEFTPADRDFQAIMDSLKKGTKH